MPVCEIPAHKIPDGHDNYRGMTIMRICFCSHFLPVKRTLFFVQFVNISSLWNAFMLKKKRIMSKTRITLQFLGRFTINHQFDRGNPPALTSTWWSSVSPTSKGNFFGAGEGWKSLTTVRPSSLTFDSFPKQNSFSTSIKCFPFRLFQTFVSPLFYYSP